MVPPRLGPRNVERAQISLKGTLFYYNEWTLLTGLNLFCSNLFSLQFDSEVPSFLQTANNQIEVSEWLRTWAVLGLLIRYLVIWCHICHIHLTFLPSKGCPVNSKFKLLRDLAESWKFSRHLRFILNDDSYILIPFVLIRPPSTVYDCELGPSQYQSPVTSMMTFFKGLEIQP